MRTPSGLRRFTVICAFISLTAASLHAENLIPYRPLSDSGINTPAAPKKGWYESINIRGYMQVRYNRLLETNPQLRCEQCDRSWGDNGGFFIRRMRIIFFGQISKQVYFYIQPDLASSVSSSSLHWGQIRDAYFDVGVTETVL